MSDNVDFIAVLMASSEEDFDFEAFFRSLTNEQVDELVDAFVELQIRSAMALKTLPLKNKIAGLVYGFSAMPAMMIHELGSMMIAMRKQDEG